MHSIQRRLETLVSDRAMPLPEFLDSLGGYLFRNWIGWSKEPANIRGFVFDQAREALKFQDAAVYALLLVEPLKSNKVPKEILNPYGGPGEAAWTENSNGEYITVKCLVDAAYWSSDMSNVAPNDWSAIVSKDIVYVLHRGVNYPLEQLFRPCRLSLEHLLIPAPRKTFEALFCVKELPSLEWAERYKKLLHPANHELLSFCWRYLCITRKLPRHGLVSELVREMKIYLERHNFPDAYASDHLLRNIAERVLKQLSERDLNSSVLSRFIEPNTR